MGREALRVGAGGRLATWWRDLSLFWKLGTPFLVLTFVVGPLFLVVWLELEQRDFREQTTHRAEVYRALISAQASTAVALGDRIWLQRIVKGAVQGTGLRYCAVFDEEGRALSSSLSSEGVPDETLDEIVFRKVRIEGGDAALPSRLRSMKSKMGRSYLEVEAPLLFTQKGGSDEAMLIGAVDPTGARHVQARVGWLRLGMSLAEGERELRRKSLRQLGIIFAFFLCVGAIVLVATKHAVVVPLRQVVQGAHRVARGDLQEVGAVPGKDEVGVLAGAFDHMIGELRRSRDFNALVGANIPLGLVVLDEDGKIEEANEPFRSMMRPRREDVGGRSFADLVDVDLFGDHLRSCLELSARQSFSGRIHGEEGGGDVLVEGLVVALSETDRSGGRFLVVLRDVTRIEEAREREQQLERRLMESSRLASLGQLAAGAAHEFNNILQIVTNYVEISLDELEDAGEAGAELGGNLRQILKGTERASQIISRMLAFARRLRPRRSTVHLDAILRETLDLVNLDFSSRGVRVETRFGESPAVHVDTGQIQQVLINLIQNAFHAMTPGGGTLVLETGVAVHPDEDRPMAVIRVQDTGKGIATDDLPRIFDPFFSTKGVYARDEAERRLEGTGLGLALSYGIVGSHDGTITVESAVGSGSTFTIWLPVHVAMDEASAELPSVVEEGTSEEKGEGLKGLRILVVDDEADIVHLLTRYLKGHGAEEVRGVTDVNEALVHLREAGPWNVLLSDVLMPGVSGLDLARTAREEGRAERVVLLTGRYTEGVRDECAEIGVDACLCKPLRMGELVAVLRPSSSELAGEGAG